LCAVGIEFLNSKGLTTLVCSERMENIGKTKQKQIPEREKTNLFKERKNRVVTP
jgi:hypothetical protein